MPTGDLIAGSAQRAEPLRWAWTACARHNQNILAPSDKHVEDVAEDEQLGPYLKRPCAAIYDMKRVSLHYESTTQHSTTAASAGRKVV